MSDHIKQAARPERLLWELYLADGRNSPGHLKRKLFYGLWQQHLAQNKGITVTTDDTP